MKKGLIFLSLLLLVAAPSSALLRFGFHGGLDQNAQAALTYSFTDDLLGGGVDMDVSVSADEIANPYVGGLHLMFDALPVLDFELGVEVAASPYKLNYSHSDGVEPGSDSSESLVFGRLSAYASAKYTIAKLPTLKLQVGGGAGYHMMTPLFSEALLRTEVAEHGNYTLDVQDILARQAGLGYHALAALRMAPAFLPVALNLEGRYYLLPENEYGDKTNRFLSLLLGLEFGF
ncbi:MAG: hypothetical protein QF492_05775 [Candidatus Krumholzibacteria bacterium]|jgi:hypothetical protein|nr:hypothetical protein [Candidatus Krumholzibacteria bacterium]